MWPRVVRLRDLPVDTVAGDAVGVVAVGRGGVEEDARPCRPRTPGTLRQGLPVLEDVAPVALVVEPRVAVLVAKADLRTGSTGGWVAVPAAERQRQVLTGQTPQVDVPAGVGDRDEIIGPQPVRQCAQHLGTAGGGRRAPLGDERPDITRVDEVPVGGDAAAHVVEQHVGRVVDGRGSSPVHCSPSVAARTASRPSRVLTTSASSCEAARPGGGACPAGRRHPRRRGRRRRRCASATSAPGPAEASCARGRRPARHEHRSPR